jgi:hypothetical protein
MVCCMQFLCLVAYGAQRQNIRTDVNKPTYCSFCVFHVYVFVFFFYEKNIHNKLYGLCFSWIFAPLKSLKQFIEVDNRCLRLDAHGWNESL